MGRIKAYRESLFRPMHDYDPNNLKTIILTTDDQPTKFDSLFKSEGIDVFRIPKSEIVITPHMYILFRASCTNNIKKNSIQKALSFLN